MSRSTASRWRADRRLHLMHPGVYALGHRSIPVEGRLVAALLYAGADAVLSHTTAAWWWQLIPDPPSVIELSAPRHIRPSHDLLVHQRSHLERTRHRRFPVTTVPQTLLDYAATATLLEVRQALAQAEFRRLLNPQAVRAALGRGRIGSEALRRALDRHEPRLARVRSKLELVFIPLCESAGIPLPEINVRVAGWTVDALWRRERVVVELDGYDNHSTPRQMKRDRREELELRAAGYLVIRYTWEQVTSHPEMVAADLLATLQERRVGSAAGSA